jgi:hypothetical protein
MMDNGTTVEAIQSLLLVTLSLDEAARRSGSWGIHARLSALGVKSPNRRKDLVNKLLELQKRDRELRDVIDGAHHQLKNREFVALSSDFYNSLLEALPETMMSFS